MSWTLSVSFFILGKFLAIFSSNIFSGPLSLFSFWDPYNVKSVCHSIVSDSLQPHGLQPARLLCPWNSLGENTGLGSHSLL